MIAFLSDVTLTLTLTCKCYQGWGLYAESLGEEFHVYDDVPHARSVFISSTVMKFHSQLFESLLSLASVCVQVGTVHDRPV